MKIYSTYNDSGILWIRKKPENWAVCRSKALFQSQKETNLNNKETNVLSLTLKGVIRNNKDKPIGLSPSDYSTYQIFEKGDLVFKLIDLNNIATSRVGLVPERGIMSSAYIRLIPRSADLRTRYFYMQYYSLWLRNIFNNLGAGVRQTINANELLNMKIVVPSPSEQDQIVRFLDWKVSSINKLIRTKIKEINLLRELKQVLINKELLAKSNRERVPLKRYVKSNRESLSERTSENHRIEYLDIGSVGYGYIKKKPKYYTFSEAPSRARRIVRSGDTIISTVRTYLRSVCYIDDDFDGCIVSTGFCVLTPNHQIVPEFLGFVLSSDAFINEVVRASVGTSYPAINESKLLSIKISLPEHIDEQRKIISDLSKKLEKIDRTISYINDLIVTYKELKTRLISDVVTGQIDVRNIEIPEYEYVDEELESDSDDVDGDFDSEDISEEA